MGLELRKSASFILSGGSSATPAVAASAELLMGAAIAISYGMDKIDRCAAPQRQRQCGSTRAAAKPAKCSRSYVGSRMCPHKLLRSMRTRGGQPQTAPLASLPSDISAVWLFFSVCEVYYSSIRGINTILHLHT